MTRRMAGTFVILTAAAVLLGACEETKETSVPPQPTVRQATLSRGAVISLVAETVCFKIPILFDDSFEARFDSTLGTWTVTGKASSLTASGARFIVVDDSAQVIAENESARSLLTIFRSGDQCHD